MSAAVAAFAACLIVPAAAGAAARSASPLHAAGIAAPPASLLAHVMHVAGQAAPDYPGAVSEPASSANYTFADRPLTDPITRLVIHVAEGGWASTYDWFRNPRAEASANYVVSPTGRVAQMVPDRDIAWHAGNWAYNESSIGIEHAGFTNRTRFPDAEYRGSARLAGWLAHTFLIPPDRRHVIGHSQVPDPNHPGQWGGVDHHTDPGRTWSWPRYMAYLRAYAHDTYQQVVDDAGTAGVRYDPAVWHVASTQSGHYGAGYLTAAPTKADSPVRFRLQTPATDRYDLLMRWPCGADSTRVAVGVATVHGRRTATVDEAAGCGRWNFVGSYRLAAGSGWRLDVSSSSPARGPIVADAFALVEGSDPTPPTAPAVTVHAGETELGVSWTAASDNIGVGGYRAVVDSVDPGARHGPHARAHGPRVRHRPRRLGAGDGPGLEPLGQAAGVGAHGGLPAAAGRPRRRTAAACGRAHVVGARGRAHLRRALERPPARVRADHDRPHGGAPGLLDHAHLHGGERGHERRGLRAGARDRDDAALLRPAQGRR